MTHHLIPLSNINQHLCVIDDWFDSNRNVVGPLERIALEEVWNSYYSLAQVCKMAPDNQQQLLTNLSTLYLETVRLQQFLLQHASVNQNAETILLQLRQTLEQLETAPKVKSLLEAADRITESHATHHTNTLTNHSIPSSPTPRPEGLPTINNDNMVSAEQLHRLLSGYASGVSNEQLAHELIMDPSFQLQKASPASELEQRIDTIARKAFFDQCDDDIQQGNYEKSVLPLIQDIKSRLLSFVSETSSVYRTIDEALDMTLLKQQLPALDLHRVIELITDIMLQMAAPIRDEAIRQIKQTDNQSQQLCLVMETLELMSLDLVNFRLKSLRPHLVPMAVEYEHDTFAQAIANGSVGLAKTRVWLQQALQRLINKRHERGTTQEDETPFTTNEVVDEGYLGLFTATTAWSRLTCPETVLLDVERIIHYQNEIQQVTIVAALALLARNIGVKDIKPFTKRMFFLLKEDTSTKGNKENVTLEHLSLEMERALSESISDKTTIDNQKKQWIRSMVGKTLSHSDPVYGLLSQRTASAIRHYLSEDSHLDDSALLQSGLETVRPQLQAISMRVKIFAEHNRRVYAPWYKELVTDLQHHK